jgi:pathogenesis-related protein 1
MRAARRLIVAACGALLLATSLLAGGPPGAGLDARGLTRAQADEMLRAHNAWRSRAGAPALRWADDLAARAQRRAEYLAAHGCRLEHGPLPLEIGENLFYGGPMRAAGREPGLVVITPTEVVDEWGAEFADYDASRGACAPGRRCGHYTQVVWPSTEKVGCGAAVCPSLGQVWACNYRPAGNVRILR